MPVSNPIGPRITYSEINEENLLNNVREIIDINPTQGNHMLQDLNEAQESLFKDIKSEILLTELTRLVEL